MAWIICKYGSGGGGGGDRPDGSTVTPVSDVPTWLRCGGLESKGYTTLSQVLADADTLNGLMSDANAVNYLVRSTSWISDISVPAMTSATTPSGEVIWYGSSYSSSKPWYAFDKQGDSTSWQVSNSVGAYCWLAYKFNTPVVCTEAKVRATGNRWDDWKIQGSLDGVSWTDLTLSHAYVSGVLDSEFTLNTTIPYLYYRFYGKVQSATPFINTLDFIVSKGITSNQSAMTYIGANDYAAYKLLSNSSWLTSIADSSYMNLVLTTSVPAMTSNTTPDGEVFYSSSGSDLGWRAFNPSVRSGCYMNGGGPNAYLGYIFTSATSIFVADLYNHPNYYHAAKRLEVSLVPAVNYTPMSDYISTPAGSHVKITITNPPTARYWRVYGKDPNGSYTYMLEMNFYGRTFGDVQSWLKAGKVDKNYTTLEQVLADSSTLQALMASSDAVDYLRACGNWASTICANQSAMNYIGLNNYAANTLLSDICWCNAIANSQYIESVLNVKVPTMTSDTTPSGKCSCSHGNAQTWQAFDGNDSTRMNLVSSSINYEWVGYEFETPKSVRKIKDLVYGTINTRVSSAKLQYSLDGNTWNDIQTFSDYKNSSSHEYAINTSQMAKYWRIYVSFNANDYISYHTIQLYGRQNV